MEPGEVDKCLSSAKLKGLGRVEEGDSQSNIRGRSLPASDPRPAFARVVIAALLGACPCQPENSRGADRLDLTPRRRQIRAVRIGARGAGAVGVERRPRRNQTDVDAVAVEPGDQLERNTRIEVTMCTTNRAQGPVEIVGRGAARALPLTTAEG